MYTDMEEKIIVILNEVEEYFVFMNLEEALI